VLHIESSPGNGAKLDIKLPAPGPAVPPPPLV